MAAILPALISAGGNIAGSMLANRGSQETKTQRTQRKLVDRLISSLGGNGEFSGLYSTSDDVFDKTFRQPALSQFRNSTAPQIQQQYIAGGQQRGTGLDDTLTRAGVDLDQLLNQHFMDYQQGAQNRQQNTISSILGLGAGAPNAMSSGQALRSGVGGYLNSDAFNNTVASAFKPNAPTAPASPSIQPSVFEQTPRKGFLPDRGQLPQFQYRM